MDSSLTLVNLFITAINVGILGLCLKLYTEYFKDKSIGSKAAAMRSLE